jgi:hypothetical protein
MYLFYGVGEREIRKRERKWEEVGTILGREERRVGWVRRKTITVVVWCGILPWEERVGTQREGKGVPLGTGGSRIILWEGEGCVGRLRLGVFFTGREKKRKRERGLN